MGDIDELKCVGIVSGVAIAQEKRWNDLAKTGEIRLLLIHKSITVKTPVLTQQKFQNLVFRHSPMVADRCTEALRRTRQRYWRGKQAEKRLCAGMPIYQLKRFYYYLFILPHPMDSLLYSPGNKPCNTSGVDLSTPVRTLEKKYSYDKLEAIQTPIHFSSNIFNQLLQISKHSSNRIYETPPRLQHVSHALQMEELQAKIQSVIRQPPLKTPDINLKPRRRPIPKSHENLKTCNCQKSNCLKKYCDCYKVGQGCSEQCRCYGCQNRDAPKKLAKRYQQRVLCNCKKSQCLKNYCECRAASQGCSQLCGCVECKNHRETKQATRKKRKLNEE